MVKHRTITAYESDWRNIRKLLDGAIPADPNTLTEPMTVEQVLTYMNNATTAAGTVQRWLAATRHYHIKARLLSPTYHPDVTDFLAELELYQDPNRRRVNGIARADMPRFLNASINSDTSLTKKARDKAILLLGWFGQMERGEIAGLDIGDFRHNGRTWTAEIHHHRSMRKITLPRELGVLDVADAVNKWMEYLPDSGALFRRVDRWGNVMDARISGQTVAIVVKECAKMAGYDETRYSGNSLKWGPQ